MYLSHDLPNLGYMSWRNCSTPPPHHPPRRALRGEKINFPRNRFQTILIDKYERSGHKTPEKNCSYCKNGQKYWWTARRLKFQLCYNTSMMCSVLIPLIPTYNRHRLYAPYFDRSRSLVVDTSHQLFARSSSSPSVNNEHLLPEHAHRRHVWALRW